MHLSPRDITGGDRRVRYTSLLWFYTPKACNSNLLAVIDYELSAIVVTVRNISIIQGLIAHCTEVLEFG